ncbi:MAG: transposase-like protein [Planctomycetota bacterium]|jgi:transposase-like protein
MSHERGEMKKTTGIRVGCPNCECEQHGRHGAANVVLHGFSKVNGGRRRRYRCTSCSKTFGATTGTPYKRLQYSKSRFDRVAALSVEGVNKSAIARPEGFSWNTVARWLDLAAALTRRFNAKHLRGHELVELQLDGMNTFLQSRKQQTWVFASIDVWSRLWPATLVGARTSRNTRRFVRSIADTSHGGGTPLITTDGFKFYAPTIRHVFGVGCVLAQVIKKIRRNRVVRVGTKLIVGTEWRLADALNESEDSTKLNTAFIERPEPHDPPGLRVPTSSIALPCTEEADARRPPGAFPHLRWLRAATQRIEVREGDANAGNAGRSRAEAVQLPGHLHGALRRGPLCHCPIPDGGVSRGT